jgi:hypothetical protein
VQSETEEQDKQLLMHAEQVPSDSTKYPELQFKQLTVPVVESFSQV